MRSVFLEIKSPGISEIMTDYFPRDERVRYGLALEPVLLPKISEFLQDDIKKVEYQYSNLDYIGQHTWSELKVRTSDYHYTDPIMKDGWLLPAAKIRKAFLECKKKDIWFFYLWERDGSLWAMKFDGDDFVDVDPRVPEWHHDKQPHYYVDESMWNLIGNIKIDCRLKRKQCLITDDD